MKDKKTTILLVDDDPDALILVGARLRAAGYEVITAEDGEEALEKVRRETPALLVLDINMPKINGFEVCRILKSDPSTRSIPIIFFTAKSQKEDKIKQGTMGAQAYIIKPFDPKILLSIINNLLSGTSEV